jgi:hypothetical protein
MLKVTDTFIGCTDGEFEHSKRYLGTLRPSDIFLNNLWARKSMNISQRYIPKQGIYFRILFICHFISKHSY